MPMNEGILLSHCLSGNNLGIGEEAKKMTTKCPQLRINLNSLQNTAAFGQPHHLGYFWGISKEITLGFYSDLY
jgi:hypothetical protein